jgi:hypothetical protein
MLAVVTNTTRFLTGSGIHSWVEVALGSMVVTVARFAVMRLSSFSWFPGEIMVERFALFTVQTNGVMLAHTSSMNHDVVDTVICGNTLCPFDRGALISVAVTEAVASDDHFVQ